MVIIIVCTEDVGLAVHDQRWRDTVVINSPLSCIPIVSERSL